MIWTQLHWEKWGSCQKTWSYISGSFQIRTLTCAHTYSGSLVSLLCFLWFPDVDADIKSPACGLQSTRFARLHHFCGIVSVSFYIFRLVHVPLNYLGYVFPFPVLFLLSHYVMMAHTWCSTHVIFKTPWLSLVSGLTDKCTFYCKCTMKLCIFLVFLCVYMTCLLGVVVYFYYALCHRDCLFTWWYCYGVLV